MGSMLRRCAAAAAGVVLTLVCLVEPASAGDRYAGCPQTYFCVWAASDFNDGPGKWQNDEANYAAWGHGTCPSGTWSNCVSSVFNNGQNCAVTFYDGSSYTGAFFYRLQRGGYLANLAYDKWSDGTSPNDKISSHKWC
ncbi:peptidase inhibitor family I36 protein [Micromonospora sp. NBC_01412]|uniref:peptidase inhibitor family I36 protein n=1 Tax=Micromonospora sp. NBC_01412 TaxID=2903590 RepID=UPI00324BD9CF